MELEALQEHLKALFLKKGILKRFELKLSYLQLPLSLPSFLVYDDSALCHGTSSSAVWMLLSSIALDPSCRSAWALSYLSLVFHLLWHWNLEVEFHSFSPDSFPWFCSHPILLLCAWLLKHFQYLFQRLAHLRRFSPLYFLQLLHSHCPTSFTYLGFLSPFTPLWVLWWTLIVGSLASKMLSAGLFNSVKIHWQHWLGQLIFLIDWMYCLSAFRC